MSDETLSFHRLCFIPILPLSHLARVPGSTPNRLAISSWVRPLAQRKALRRSPGFRGFPSQGVYPKNWIIFGTAGRSGVLLPTSQL